MSRLLGKEKKKKKKQKKKQKKKYTGYLNNLKKGKCTWNIVN